MTLKHILLISIMLVVASIFGSTTLINDTITFESNSVKVWDAGFLFRESVIVLDAYDRTPNPSESWKSLMMYIMDDAQYRSYIESNDFDSFKPYGNNLEGIASYSDTHIRFRVPYEDSWHIVVINKEPASKEYLEKVFVVNVGVEYKAGILRYPGFLGIMISGLLYFSGRNKVARARAIRFSTRLGVLDT